MTENYDEFEIESDFDSRYERAEKYEYYYRNYLQMLFSTRYDEIINYILDTPSEIESYKKLNDYKKTKYFVSCVKHLVEDDILHDKLFRNSFYDNVEGTAHNMILDLVGLCIDRLNRTMN